MKHLFARLFAWWRWRPAPDRSDPAPALGEHHAMPAGAAPMLDCEAVMRQLWDYLDGELTPERAAAIRAHLELCRRCYPQYEFERSFLDAVAASARQHSNLERLRAQLAESLKAKGLKEA